MHVANRHRRWNLRSPATARRLSRPPIPAHNNRPTASSPHQAAHVGFRRTLPKIAEARSHGQTPERMQIPFSEKLSNMDGEATQKLVGIEPSRKSMAV